MLQRYLPKGKNGPWSTGPERLARKIQGIMHGKPRKLQGYRAPNAVVKEWDPMRRLRSWKKTMAVNSVGVA